MPDPFNGRETLRELIQREYPGCVQELEDKIFWIASAWGDRRASRSDERIRALETALYRAECTMNNQRAYLQDIITKLTDAAQDAYRVRDV